MPTYRPILAGLGLAALLGACAGNRDYGPDSPYYAYPGDMRINLTRALEIPPGEATLRFQYGRTVARNGVQETDPYCIFELDTVSESPQQVAAESFRITRMERRVETFSGMPAIALPTVGRGLGRDDGPSHVYYITQFRLHSDRQAKVRTLACQHNQASAGIAVPRHLTLAEIRQALGDQLVLELPR